MKKQVNGQINLFDLIGTDNEKISKMEFAECRICWCRDCRHNEYNEAVPRDFAGENKPCPSCKFCENNKKAEICEVGSYENGCKLRAEEEGIFF